MVSKAKKGSQFGNHERFIVPSVIGGVISWIFSGDFGLGILVFVAIWAGNWVGYEFLKRK